MGDPNEAKILSNLTHTPVLNVGGDGVNLGVYTYDRENQLYYSMGTSNTGEALPVVTVHASVNSALTLLGCSCSGSSFSGLRPQHNLKVFDAWKKEVVKYLPIAFPLYHMQWDHHQKVLLGLANLYDPTYGRNVTLVKINTEEGHFEQITNVSSSHFPGSFTLS